VTWTLIILLTLGAYAFKVTALVMKDTFTQGQELVLDARALGIAVAVIAAWRKAPLIVVIVLGAAVTALVRQI
jgi:branched-subunit amino acid transport protein